MKKRTYDDFSSLKNFLQEVKEFTQELNYISPENRFLYHYTDLSGLSGIIKSHNIWLTNSMYSNDDEEITYGYRIVKEVIDEESKKRGRQDRKNFLMKLAELVREPTPEGVYTCSFCRDDNLLSQWRGYGANGTGVSIAFDGVLLIDMLVSDESEKGLMRIWKVFYKKETQKKIIRKAIDFFFNMTVSEEDKPRLAADAIQFFIPTFKHSGFEEEQEYRLIFTPFPDCNSELDFRVARGMLIPYYTFRSLIGMEDPNSQYQLPLTGVRVGPSMNKSLNIQSVRMLLEKAGYSSIEIKSADIPYRG